MGVRAFSDDEQDKAAASVGLNYMLGSQSWRGSGKFDFGIGGGGANTTDGDTAPVEDNVVLAGNVVSETPGVDLPVP